MKITVNQAKQLIDLIQENNIVSFFEKLDLFGVNNNQANNFRKEFIFGRFNYDFYDRLQVFASSLADKQFTFEKKQPKYDLFFSFSSKNQNEAEQIVAELRQTGVTVFFSMDLEEQAGQDFGTLIRNALANSTHFMLYCTPQAIVSKWVKYECETFFHYYVESDKARRFFILEGIGFNIELLKSIGLQSIQTSKNVTNIISFLKTSYQKIEVITSKSNNTLNTQIKKDITTNIETNDIDNLVSFLEKIYLFCEDIFPYSIRLNNKAKVLEYISLPKAKQGLIHGTTTISIAKLINYAKEFYSRLNYRLWIENEKIINTQNALQFKLFSIYFLLLEHSDLDGKRIIVRNKLGKFGYVDLQGNLVIPFEYDDACPFSEGLAFVQKKIPPKKGFFDVFSERKKRDREVWGFIDEDGNQVTDFKFQYCSANGFFKGNTKVTDYSEFGDGKPKSSPYYIDTKGNKI